PGSSLFSDPPVDSVPPSEVLRARTYLCLPTLDMSAPDEKVFQHLVSRVVGWQGTVYVHCAAGHGRSATVAAAVLIARCLAGSVEEAEHLMRKVRPGIRLAPAQRSLLRRITRPLPTGKPDLSPSRSTCPSSPSSS